MSIQFLLFLACCFFRSWPELIRWKLPSLKTKRWLNTCLEAAGCLILSSLSQAQRIREIIMAEHEDLTENGPHSSIRCRYCGQRNQLKSDGGDARCGRCRMPLSDAPHKKFANLDKDQYI